MLLKYLKDRNNVIALILIILLIALIMRLFQLQVVNFGYYSDLSENKRIRKINVEAPRGLFLDRYGREIAGNRPGYVIEIVKTEIVDEKLNYVVQNVVETLRENGERVKIDFPITLDPLEYRFKNSQEEVEWKKKYGVPQEYDAEQAFLWLRDKNDISQSLSDDLALDILGVLHKIKEQGYRSYQPVEIARDVSMRTVARIEENHMDLPGVNVEVKPIRYYREGELAAHVLGYLGSINPGELERLKEKGYDRNDIIGKSGLEKVLEEELKGIDGGKQVEVDALGRFIRTLGEEYPIPGDNVFLTIDNQLQKTAETVMAETIAKIQSGEMGHAFPNARSGAVAAIDVKTGEILVMASFPSYDPNQFATGISQEDWNALNPQTSDPMAPRPMFNNAIQAAAPPGSTFKMITATAGLEEGVITPETIIVDKGVYTKVPGARPACWIWNEQGRTHGPQKIVDAIKHSCNYYFYEVGNRLGIEKMEEYAKKFGLGQKSGIEIPGESAGIVAGPAYKSAIWKNVIKRYMENIMGVHDDEKIEQIQNLIYREFSTWNEMRRTLEGYGITERAHINKLIPYINAGRWLPGETLSAAIGQTHHIYTPLQMANYIATLANGGTRYRPHLIKKAYDQNTGEYRVKEPEIVEEIKIYPENLKAIHEGMHEVTKLGGTAGWYFYDFPLEAAGKTGTAQNPGYDSYAWFVGFAPYEDPQIAVAVVVLQGGHGNYSAPVAKAIFEEYLKVGKEGVEVDRGNVLVQ